MSELTQVIKDILIRKIEDIDSGNSNIDQEGLTKIVQAITDSTDNNIKVSKYKFATLLNISTSTFDNYVKEGKIPRGRHEIGFKEKFWTMRDVNNFKRNIRRNRK